MSYVQRFRTSFLTDTTSSARAFLSSSTETNPGTITGIIDTILYYKDGTSPPTTAANFTITVENTSQAIFNRTSIANEASFEVCPVRQPYTVTGTTLATATAGIEGVPVVNSRLIIDVSTAGASKAGIFEVIVR